MINKLIFITIIFFLLQIPQISFSQAIIHTIDGKLIEIQIMEISESEIKYKKCSYLDGPTYIVNRSHIEKIVYNNGMVEYYSSKYPLSKLNGNDYGRNIYWTHLLETMVMGYTISYERILKNNSNSMQITIGTRFEETGGGQDGIYSGFGINSYPYGLGKRKFFFGPSIQIGYGEGLQDDVSGRTEKVIFYYSRLHMNHGLIVHRTKYFTTSFILSLGLKYMSEETHSWRAGVSQSGGISIRMGFRI